MKKFLTLALVGAMCLSVTGSALASKPKTVWEDPEGDADLDQGLASLPGGFDLASGSIARQKNDLIFTVAHHEMPSSGTVPEGVRFLWSFAVDGTPWRLTVKRADIGKPDVLGQNGTERVGKVDANGHFRLEAECVTDNTLPVGMVNCPPEAYLEGEWNPGEKSFSVTVPLEVIGAKTKSVVGPGPENICVICWVSHYAERSLSTTIIDRAGMTTTYKVPKK
jgi:hypothetical protein